MTKTRDEITALLESNDRAVEVGIYRIFQLQTEDEKQASETKHSNGVGFGARDADFGTSLAKQVEQNRMIGRGDRTLSEKQIAAARRMCIRYGRQLTAIANGELSVPLAPWENAPEPEPREVPQPEPGTYAYTARLMHSMDPAPNGDPDFWDKWKDEQKEGAY